MPRHVVRPAYRRDRHGIGVVHLGVGAFHRAHQAVYLDDALAREGGDWRVLGVSLRSGAVRDRLAPQDGLYTLVERGAGGERRRVIGSLAGVLVAPEDPAAVVAALARADVPLVSLTITEKGYHHDPTAGGLAVGHPDIVHDLAHPDRPRSAPGLIVAALARRRDAGAPAPTLLSCDNLSGNGAVLRTVLVELAARRDAGLARWIDREVACPSTMVDRIAPATTPADVDALEAATGCRDEAMVATERFTQWVVEDRFAGPRPDLAAVGARLVDDVRPFELAKLRMLNGAHSTLAYLGALAGFEHVHEVVARPDFAALVRHLMTAEAAPGVTPARGQDLAGYADALMARFADPGLRHSVRQIAADGSKKLPERLVGVVRDGFAAGRSIEAATLGIAGWMRYAMGRDEDGRAYRVDDPLADRLAAIGAGAADPDVLAARMLSLQEVFGDLGAIGPVRERVARHLRSLLASGARATVADVVGRLSGRADDPVGSARGAGRPL